MLSQQALPSAQTLLPFLQFLVVPSSAESANGKTWLQLENVTRLLTQLCCTASSWIQAYLISRQQRDGRPVSPRQHRFSSGAVQLWKIVQENLTTLGTHYCDCVVKGGV
jgi:hypothetical protein